MVPLKPWPTDHAMLETVYARLLPERGHRIEWVMRSSLPRPPRAVRWHGSLVHLTPDRPGRTSGALLRRVSLLREVTRVARGARFDAIQVRNGVAFGLLAIALRRATGARFVYQYSFPVLEWSASTAWRHRSPVARLLARCSRLAIPVRGWMLRRADLVLAISDRLREDLLRAGVRPDRVVIFPLGAAEQAVSSPSVEALRERLRLGDAPVVLYFGSISPERELDFVVRVAARVGESRRDVRWLLVGPATDGEDVRLRALAEHLGVANRVLILGVVPRADVATYLELCELTVSPIPPTELYLMSSPSKTVESLAAGRPVVGTPIPDQADLIRRSAGGTVAAFDVDAFSEAVLELLDDDGRRRAAGESGRAFVREHRGYDRLADDVERAYRAMPGMGR